eukprot:gene6743-7034_t
MGSDAPRTVDMQSSTPTTQTHHTTDSTRSSRTGSARPDSAGYHPARPDSAGYHPARPDSAGYHPVGAGAAALPPVSAEAAALLADAAELQRAQRAADARGACARAVDAEEAAAGAGHPSTLRPLTDAGDAALRMKEYADAEGWYRRALRVADDAVRGGYGELSVDAHLAALNNLAYCIFASASATRNGGRSAEGAARLRAAAPLYQRYVTVAEHAGDDARLADGLQNLGSLHANVGAFASGWSPANLLVAEAELSRAVAILTALVAGRQAKRSAEKQLAVAQRKLDSARRRLRRYRAA